MNVEVANRSNGAGADTGAGISTLPDDGDGYEEVPASLAVRAATSITEVTRTRSSVGTAGSVASDGGGDGDGDGYEVLPESLAINVAVDVEVAEAAPQQARAGAQEDQDQAIEVLADDESRL